MSQYVVRPRSEVTHYSGYSHKTREEAEEWIRMKLGTITRNYAGLDREPTEVSPSYTQEFVIVRAVDPRDARIAELEAALAAALQNAQVDRAARDGTYAELIEAGRLCADANARLDAAMQRNTECLRWKTSAQRIANCAVSAIEYLRTTGPDEPYPDETDRMANAGVDLVVVALREMQQ